MQTTTSALEMAFECFQNGALTEGVSIIQKEADSGEVNAMFTLGQLFHKGIGVQKNSVIAREWVNKASEKGHADATLYLAGFYLEGDGVESSLERALEILEESARSGNSYGYVQIGRIYESGEFGAVINIQLAASYYQKAIDKNDAEAMFLLGLLYLNGKGFSKDTLRAFQLINNSAQAGNIRGINGLAYLYETGFEGHAIDSQRANDLYRKSARLGDEHAKQALTKFPPVIKLGTISCSPAIASISDGERAELIKMHSSGNWGDVKPSVWDENDAALTSKQVVFSLYEFSTCTIVIQTDIRGSHTFLEILDEDMDGLRVDIGEGISRIKKLKKLYDLWKIANDFIGGHVS